MKKTFQMPKNVTSTGTVKAKGLLRFVQTLAVVTTLSGCASALSVGSPEYGCSGLPEGVQCMSARDVYAATDDGKVPAPMVKGDGKSKKTTKKDKQASSEASEQQENTGRDSVVDTYVAPNLPDKPVPIRTPAQVMRIWVAPWEDTNGDLITTGYIYTEIEPRRWVIGEPEMFKSPTLKPLQTIKPAKNTRGQ